MHESARPDLCGGARATGVPTAMVNSRASLGMNTSGRVTAPPCAVRLPGYGAQLRVQDTRKA